MEEIVLNKWRHHYEDVLKWDSHNYDAWIDLIWLEEEWGDEDIIRDTFEKAISNIPDELEKWYWGRYVILWMLYAIWEESSGRIERAWDVLEKIQSIIPHNLFSFSKIWIMIAHFYVW